MGQTEESYQFVTTSGRNKAYYRFHGKIEFTGEQPAQEVKKEVKDIETTPKPKLTINRITGDITKIEGEKDDEYQIDNPTLQVLLQLAKRPGGIFRLSIIHGVASRAIGPDALKSGRPGIDQIEKLQKMFGQTEETFQYISKINMGKDKEDLAYSLNTVVEIIEKSKNPAKESIQEPVQEAKKEEVKISPELELIKLEHISLDKEELLLIINKTQKFKLYPYELILVSYLYEHLGEKFSVDQLDKIISDAGYRTKTSTAIRNIETRFGSKFFGGDRGKGKKSYWSLEIENANGNTDVAVPPPAPQDAKETKEAQEERLILLPEEAEILMSLVRSKDNTTIIFNQGSESVKFETPDWIKKAPEVSKPTHFLATVDLLKTRRRVLRMAKAIIENDDKDKTIGDQEENIGILLLWLKSGDNQNAPAGLSSQNYRLTLQGLINFLLDDNYSTDIYYTNQLHQGVDNFRAEYKPVDEDDVERISSPTITPTPVTAVPDVANIFISEDEKREFDKRKLLLEKATAYIDRVIQIPQLSKAIKPNQVYSLFREISETFLRKNIDNGKIKAERIKGEEFLPSEEIILLLLLKNNKNLSTQEIHRLRKIIIKEVNLRRENQHA